MTLSYDVPLSHIKFIINLSLFSNIKNNSETIEEHVHTVYTELNETLSLEYVKVNSK